MACPVKNAAIEEAISVTAATAPNTDDVQDALLQVPVVWTPACNSERDVPSGVWVVEFTRMLGLAGWPRASYGFAGEQGRLLSCATIRSFCLACAGRICSRA